jgi:hypothetical protein
MTMAIVKNSTPIRTLADWETLAPPKRPNQWKDGRSAKEAAKAWLTGAGLALPPEVEAILMNHKAFGMVKTWTAEPEAKLRFDGFRGEPRNTDLAVDVVDEHGKYLLAVEAKADEPFGGTVDRTRLDAEKRHEANNSSKGVERIEQLRKALFGTINDEDHIGKVRYQLLTACAGALCEADRKGYTRTVMLVHEFVTDETTDERHKANATALDDFVEHLSGGSVTKIHPGQLSGPFKVPGSPLLTSVPELYIGKVQRYLRTP